MVIAVMIASMVLSVSSTVYLVSGLVLTGGKRHLRPVPRIWNHLWRWTKWPALVAVLTDIPVKVITGSSPINPVDYLALLIGLYLWWRYRNAGDDDPWDKLKDAIKEKVAEIHGKLVVVPAGA